MSAAKRRILIVSLILIALIAGYFLGGKNLIYPPRASEDLTLYNIDSRADASNHFPTRTIRWKTLPVAVYDKVGIKNLQNIIDEWNQAIGRMVFVLGGPDSPIVIDGNSEVSPGGFFTFSFKNYLLTRAEITINSLWTNNPELANPKIIKNPNEVIKHFLGYALGFFGNTVDDPNGVMDLEYFLNEKNTISPFVVSIIKELYSLPAGTRASKPIDRQLRWAVKKYNIDSRAVQYRWDTLQELKDYERFKKLPAGAEMPTVTMRWRSLPVAVYDRDKMVPELDKIIAEWNQAMGQEVLKIGGPDSPIVIEADPNQGPYELFFITPKKVGRLDKIRFVNNPKWVTSSKIKHQLGHALGFFGHTTDDPEGIMDADDNKQKIISPLVISVLKELYKMPCSIRIVDQFGRPEKEIIALRQAIKKYNIDPRGGEKLAIRTARWRSFPVSVYNQANVSNLQGILDEWNQAMGYEVFKIGGSDSPIVIEIDSDQNPAPYPTFNIEIKNDLITAFKIKVNPQQSNLHYLKHQLGHALGFFGHTKDDDPNGIMNEDHRRTDTVISSFVVSVLKELYNLPPGTLINY